MCWCCRSPTALFHSLSRGRPRRPARSIDRCVTFVADNKNGLNHLTAQISSAKTRHSTVFWMMTWLSVFMVLFGRVIIYDWPLESEKLSINFNHQPTTARLSCTKISMTTTTATATTILLCNIRGVLTVSIRLVSYLITI